VPSPLSSNSSSVAGTIMLLPCFGASIGQMLHGTQHDIYLRFVIASVAKQPHKMWDVLHARVSVRLLRYAVAEPPRNDGRGGNDGTSLIGILLLNGADCY
jgi:hypothetical protein